MSCILPPFTLLFIKWLPILPSDNFIQMIAKRWGGDCGWSHMAFSMNRKFLWWYNDDVWENLGVSDFMSVCLFVCLWFVAVKLWFTIVEKKPSWPWESGESRITHVMSRLILCEQGVFQQHDWNLNACFRSLTLLHHQFVLPPLLHTLSFCSHLMGCLKCPLTPSWI